MNIIINVLEGVVVALEIAIAMIGAILMCLLAIIQYPFLYLIGGRKLCARVSTEIADWYWSYLTAAVEVWGRWELVFSGDYLPPNETAFVIVNHRWVVDWLMILCTAKRKGRLGCSKFFAKDSIKFIPGIGWGIWMLDYIFLARNWSKDQESINRTFKNLKDRKFPFWLVSHVEGTRLTPEKLKQSQDFAKKKDLPIWNNVLLPRSKGFVSTIQGLDDTIKAVYDFTIVYEDGRRPPTFSSMAFRRGGRAHIHTRRYPIETLPKKEEELNDWLMDRWIEKEKLIDTMLKEGNFPRVYKDPYCHTPMKLNEMK